MRFPAWSCAIVLGLPASRVLAEPSDATARVERLADGVYAILHDDSTKEWPTGATDWPHGNTGVIVGGNAVLVVDTTFLPSRAKADLALIRLITDKPVRYIVNTHWHGDHTHGNGVYRAAFPDAVIVGPRENRRYIELNLARAPRAITAPESGQRKVLAQLEGFLASGKDGEGRTLSDADKKRLELNVRQRRHELQDLANVQIAPPDLLFRELTIVLNRGRANSPADVTIYLPDEQVLFTGDIVVHPVPYAMQAHPVPWLDVLRQLEATPVKALVPGHGPVMRDHSYTRKVRELIEAATSRVASRAREGMNADQVQAIVKLDDLRARFVKDSDPDGLELWDYSIQKALVERSWACLVGYRC
jgi:cyclase